MGCWCSKNLEEDTERAAQEIEDKIFAMLRDNFCASGAEASLMGSILKDDMMTKLQAKRKKLDAVEAELRVQDPADFFMHRCALIDPEEGEILITHARIMHICSKFDIDELYMVYERLRCLKVAKLREKHGTNIVSIIDEDGGATYSNCPRGGEGERPHRHPRSSSDRPHSEEDTGGSIFDPRQFIL